MATKSKENSGYSDQERAAMKARSKELAAQQRADRKRADDEKDVLDVIDAMGGTDKSIAKRIHELVTQTASQLWPKTWYGMPAYAKDGKVLCFFQAAQKFETRYATFGFNDNARLDDGNMWPASFALIELTPAEETRIVELVKRAIG